MSYVLACGVTFNQPNLRIVGGIPVIFLLIVSYNRLMFLIFLVLIIFKAVPNSWPSQVLVVFYYIYPLQLSNRIQLLPLKAICGGTLITPKVVITASHCAPTSIQYPYNGDVLTIQINPNQYFPTIQSTITVFSGVNNISFILNMTPPPPPVVVSNVSAIYIVSILINYRCFFF